MSNKTMFAIAALRDKSTPKSQIMKIVDHLVMRGSISQLEADALYRVKRLASRIHDLHLKGIQTHVEIRTDLTGKRYAKYALA